MDVTPSYDFDQFSDADRRAELGRLQRQASLMLDRELEVLRSLGLDRDSHVAEIGCGPGFLTGALAQVAGAGSAVGIDASRELLDAARTLVAPQHPNLRFQHGLADATGLPDAGCSFVYNRLLYQHLRDPLAALREARRITRPGGVVCVTDVDDGWLCVHPRVEAFERLTALAQAAQVRNGGDRFIGRKLPALMAAAGLRDIEVRVSAVSSLDLGIDAFLDITTRFKAIQIGTPEALSLLREIDMEVKAAAEAPFGIVGAFCVVGRV